MVLSFVELSKSSSLIPRLSPNVTQATQAAESWAGPGKRLPVQYITVCSRISHVYTFSAYFSIFSVYLSVSQYISIYPSIPQKTLSQYILVYTPQYFLSILSLSHSPSPTSPLLPTHAQSWLVAQTTVYGMKLSTPFQLIGQVGLDDYEKWTKWFQEEQTVSTRSDPLTCRSYAR